jgi:hypothetical protein
MAFLLSVVIGLLITYLYVRSMDRTVNGSNKDLYTEDEITQGLEMFKTWYDHHIKDSISFGATYHPVNGSALLALQEKMDENFAIMISKLAGRPITKLIANHTSKYSIKVR